MSLTEEAVRRSPTGVAAARQKAATPVDEAWGEYRSLLDALATAPDQDDARTRLRAALRRIVAGIWCLFVRRGAMRLAAVQVWFAGGAHRDYLIWYTTAKGNASAHRPATWDARSFAAPGAAGQLDLRKPAHTAKLEKVLTQMLVETADAPQVDPAVRERIIGLRKEGRRYTEIMAALHVRYHTVYHVLKEAGLNYKLPPRRW